MSKLFINIANNLIKNNDELYNYNLINIIDKLIIGSHIKYCIASKIRCGGFLLLIKKSIIRDNNILILKTNNGILELPFYNYKIYQKTKNKSKSIFESKEIRDKYLNNVSKYLNNSNNLTEDNKMIIKLDNNNNKISDNINNNNLTEDNKMIIKLDNNNKISDNINNNNLTEDNKMIIKLDNNNFIEDNKIISNNIDNNNYLLYILKNR